MRPRIASSSPAGPIGRRRGLEALQERPDIEAGAADDRGQAARAPGSRERTEGLDLNRAA